MRSATQFLLAAIAAIRCESVELHSGFVIEEDSPAPAAHASFPVGTIGNGTCQATYYHGDDCDTHPTGFFTGITSLEACAAKVKPCKMANFLTWGATDNSCSWYNECDFAHLCKDCSKDTGPNCPKPKCPHYFAFTSEVLKIPPPTPAPTPPPPPGPTPIGCFVDNATGPISYKFAPGNCFPNAPNHGVKVTDSAAHCCAMCQALENCTFYTYEHGGSTAQPTCYSSAGACCYLKTAAAWAGRTTCSQPGCVSGSTKPLPAPITCRNGTNCGGTNLWTRWEDTNPPNHTCYSTWCNPGTIPFPKSKDLVGWSFKSGCNPGYGSGDHKSASADTFYPSWAADGNLYTGWTDGNVRDDVTHAVINAKSEGSEPYGWAVRHGQAVIKGDDPFELTMTGVAAYAGQEGASPQRLSAWPYGGRFPCGSLVYKGTWFYGTYYVPTYPSGPLSLLTGGLLGPLVDFRHSTDGGKTWVEPRLNATGASDNLFGETGPLPGEKDGKARVKFGTPHWVDFGQELEHSPDGKAYIISHGATSDTSTEMWVLGDQIYMARVPPTVDAINDRAQWEFYAGGHGDGAKWVHGDVNKAVPIVEWTNHTGGSTMTYFKPLNKFVMTVQTASTYPNMDQGDFDTYFLESDSITGPWSYVTYMRNFGPQVYFGNHPSKFSAKQANTTARTYDAFLMYSANYDPHTHTPNPPNSAYHMNLQQARFDLSATFADKLAAAAAAGSGAA
eukprot:g476.t1